MVELDVLLGEDHIATLEPTRGGGRLRYDEEIASERVGKPVLSTSLPAKKRPFAEGRTGAWFENLLPEGERLMRLCRELSCAPSDYMTILSQTGWECAGAVSVTPHGADSPHEGTLVPLAQKELADRLSNLPLYDAEEALVGRMSLGGFQEKMLVFAHDVTLQNGTLSGGEFFLPEGTSLSTHILKPQLATKYPHLIQAEAWAMAVASVAARCARAGLLHLEDAPLTLVVERFDRERTDGTLVRLHQEDCCQALGLPPSHKYASAAEEKGDDPSYAKIAALLTSYAVNYQVELLELLRQMTVNYVLGNADAHAKNYAFLYLITGQPTLSPLYDVTPVLDLEPKAKHLSLRINGKVLASEIQREDLLQEAEQWGIPRAVAEQTLGETLDKLEEGIQLANRYYPEADKQYGISAQKRVGALRTR